MQRTAILISLALAFIVAPVGHQLAYSKGSEIPDTYVGWALVQDKNGSRYSSHDAENVKGQVIEIRSVFGSKLTNVPYILILEIRNQEGVTTFLQWQNDTVNEFGASTYKTFHWQPSETGQYDVRNFAISNFTQPEVLSTVKSSNAEIR
jgi:hypothetical protein